MKETAGPAEFALIVPIFDFLLAGNRDERLSKFGTRSQRFGFYAHDFLLQRNKLKSHLI